MTESEHGIAQKTQEKFEFYIISLVFTLLALSIQTAKFGSSVTADIFELSGWVALLISGISGLWRMEFIPVQRIKMAQRDDLEKKVYELKELQLKGVKEAYVLQTDSSQLLTERIKNYQDGIEALDPLIKKLDQHNMVKYYTHRYSLVIGVLLLVVARGFVPAQDVIARIFAC